VKSGHCFLEPNVPCSGSLYISLLTMILFEPIIRYVNGGSNGRHGTKRACESVVGGGFTLQLNIYVPKGKEGILAKLDAVSRDLGKPKNEIVIEALERYLRLSAATIELGRYPTKVVGSLSRKEIYGDRVKP